MWKFTWILLKSGPKSSYLVVFRGVILLNNLRNKVCEQLVINLLYFTSYTPSYNITKPYVFRFRAEKKTPRRSAFKTVFIQFLSSNSPEFWKTIATLLHTFTKTDFWKSLHQFESVWEARKHPKWILCFIIKHQTVRTPFKSTFQSRKLPNFGTKNPI